MTTMRLSPDGYWPRDMSLTEQAASVEQFEALIFPIWKGIDRRDIATEAAMTAEQAQAQRVLLECLTLHKQDLAIYNSGIKPNRMASDYSKMVEMRRRASKSTGRG